MKKLNISKINVETDRSSTMMVFAGLASVALAASIVISRIFFSNLSFDRKVFIAKNDANKQLEQNIDNIPELRKNMKILEKTKVTSKTVLNVLPSDFDFPQTSSTLETMAIRDGLIMRDISLASDQGSADASATDSSEVLYYDTYLTVSGTYENLRNFINDLSKSRRTFGLQSLEIRGGDSELVVSLVVRAYYKPAVSVDIQTEEMTK